MFIDVMRLLLHIFISLAAVYEATGNVDVPFYMGSSLQLLAAVLLFSFR